ncbi:hypothetical protein [Sphaerisporangium sp. TRM90804]|uniref:hypothetical protein n=1 Tax=Sphaerisporangium sp. TRM90804 TaxID=3031113 RepID=UPI00244BAB42|nr:hypothetical protein [Sphaerisporangium sp. TRM90804]MDH2425730.1 hypothetical protein [Sphaerisporangium sp. TRM90804]
MTYAYAYADDTTRLGLQQRSAVVLLSLLARDLPVAHWSLTDVLAVDDVDGEVEGHLSGGDDAQRRLALTAWATEFGVPATWKQYKDHDPAGAWEVRTTITGVRVRIWTQLATCPAAAAPQGDAL